MADPIGYCCLALHAHLPYVRHPEYADCLEERWLFEAITESYLPLLEVMEGWRRDGVNFRLTLSMSPTLITMLADEFLRERYRRRLARLIDLAEQEVERTRLIPLPHATARMYLKNFRACHEAYDERYRGDLVGAFASFQESGNLEIITSGATHGFLPLLQHQPAAVRAQIQVAVKHYVETFGRHPRGIWNAECGYYDGLDGLLSEGDLRFFFVDAHGLLHGRPRPKYGIFAPVYCPAGVAAFGRDQDSSKAVWSADEGYPGDPIYREFYRDIGFDLDINYIGPYIHESGLRVATGIKYHRITRRDLPLGEKEYYNVEAARLRAIDHADDFVAQRDEQVCRLAGLMDRPPIIVSPYDAELFGHWWYEGVAFLDRVMRRMCAMREALEPITPSEYLARYPINQIVSLQYSSWGSGGYAEVWLGEDNAWIYRHLHAAADRMMTLARRYARIAHGTLRRGLNQMARELLLAQSSDWAFIIKTGTMVEYAVRRTREHLANFNTLYDQVSSMSLDEALLARLEERNKIFPKLEFEVFKAEEDE